MVPGENVKARGGVAFLSYQTQAPVIPLYIKGTYNISFREFISGKKIVTLSFGKPISPLEIVEKSNPNVDDFQRGSELVMRSIQACR